MPHTLVRNLQRRHLNIESKDEISPRSIGEMLKKLAS